MPIRRKLLPAAAIREYCRTAGLPLGTGRGRLLALARIAVMRGQRGASFRRWYVKQRERRGMAQEKHRSFVPAAKVIYQFGRYE